MISTLVSAGVIPAEASAEMRQAVTSYYRKIRLVKDGYRPSSKLRATTGVTLFRASDNVWPVELLGEDYGLRAVCEGPVDVHVIPGTHESVVAGDESSTKLAGLLDTLLSGFQITQ